MQGFGVFVAKEMREIVRTWRIWVIPSILVFIGLSSPILAEITPQLISSITTDQPGLVIEIPEAVTADAYLQFTKNANQIALLAVIIACAGMISTEKRTGTAVLVLTKPLSRTSMVVAKVLSNWALLLGATVAGAAICIGVTTAIFDTTLIPEFVAAATIWFVFAAMYVACMALLSTVFGSQGGAAGAGVGLYLVVSMLSAWGPGRDYTPAGLLSAGDLILRGESVDVVVPLAVAAVVSVAAVVAAAFLFSRQEL